MDVCREEGIALIVALLMMLLLSALGAALVLTTSSETIIAGNFRNSEEALYAADAALERAMDDILTVPDWNQLLDGAAQSGFIDGPPSGTRELLDGSRIDLGQVLNVANCGKASACTSADMNAVTAARPWGSNNPRWQLYAYGKVADLLPDGSINSPYYVLVMVGDDPSETDGDPLHDGGPSLPQYVDGYNNPYPNLGTNVLVLHAEAFGPRGTHRMVDMTIARTNTTEAESGYTGQSGHDELNRRAAKTAVQTPGKALTRLEMSLATGSLVLQP